MPGVVVILDDQEGSEIGRTTTDANGRYIFAGLELGTYTLGFEALPEGASFTTAGNGDDRELDSDAEFYNTTAAVTLTPGTPAVTGIDAGLIMEGGPEPQVGSIGDVVWNDNNRDGIQDAGEWGVPGVTVTLYDADGRAVDTALTDADGKYSFTDLKYGVYSIGVDGLSSWWVYSLRGQGDDRTLDSDVDPVTGRSGTIAVDAATPDVTSIDIGVLIRV